MTNFQRNKSIGFKETVWQYMEKILVMQVQRQKQIDEEYKTRINALQTLVFYRYEDEYQLDVLL